MTYPYNDDVEEIKRLQTLLSFNILDTPPQEEFDSLVKLISLICDSPIAIISMIDDKRQWYKAKVGIPQNEVPRDQTFCRYTLEQDDLLEITDARKDWRIASFQGPSRSRPRHRPRLSQTSLGIVHLDLGLD